VIDDASAMISDANATGKHARNSQILAELEHRDSLAAWVAEAFTRSVRNNILAEGTAQAIRFAGILLFARLLSPSDFGHMRAVLAVSLIVTIFIQAGIPDALIQRRDLSRYHECAGWWMSLGITIATVSIVYLGAARIAGWMEMPELQAGIRLMCLPIFTEGTSMMSNARLERALRFDALALADVLAEVAFVVGTLVLLMIRMPQWSLMCGLAARFTVHGLTIWIADPRICLAPLRLTAVRDLLSFMLSVWGGRIMQGISDSADYLLIGRLLGSDALGVYGMARDLLRAVPNRIHKVAGRVTFSAFCALQGNDQEIAKLYAQFYNAIARIILPIVACMAVTAPDLVDTAYGHKWLATAVPLQILALGVGLAGLKDAISSLYIAKGYPSLDIYLNGLRLILVVAVIFALRYDGLLAVLAGISIVEVATSIVAQYVGGWFTGLRLSDMFKASLPGIWLAIICGSVSFLAAVVCHYFEIHGIAALVVALVPAGLVYLKLEAANLMQMARQTAPPQPASSDSAEARNVLRSVGVG
jgi:O-antigen/teichoic acid export membrane protein